MFFKSGFKKFDENSKKYTNFLAVSLHVLYNMENAQAYFYTGGLQHGKICNS